MAILRKEKREHYTVIDNSVFMDYSLSFKAKGLLCQMLSLPDGWSFSIEGLTRLASDGRDSVAKALKELETAGYFRREDVRNCGKYQGIEYIIAEKPFTEKPLTEKPITENPRQLNTKELSTKESTTKDNKRFTPPSRQEVQEYIAEKGYSVDAERFIDYYTSNGWKVGKNHMKDWKATVRNWERNNGNDFRSGGNQSRRVRESGGSRKADNERVATGFIPMAGGIPFDE